MQARRTLRDSDGIIPASQLRKQKLTPDWMTSKRLLAFTALTIFIFVCGRVVLKGTRHLSLFASSSDSVNADNLDHSLQRAATLALGDRRGTVIVMDPQTGRVRAVVNPEIAFTEHYPLGSAIKPFTAL